MSSPETNQPKGPPRISVWLEATWTATTVPNMTVATSTRAAMRRSSLRGLEPAVGDVMARPARAPSLSRLDAAGDLEDGHVHGDEQTADDSAQEDHHQRLHQLGHGAHRDVHFVLVKIGDLLEHAVHGAGLLADRDHL